MQQALENVFGALVLGPALTSPAELLELCRTHHLAEEDTAALVESFERCVVYRELVRGTLLEALEVSIPRTIERAGQLFEEYFDRFLTERAPRTHYLRDVSTEFLQWCGPLWAGDPRLPSYLHDLALHESLHIEVSALPTIPRGHAPSPLELGRSVELSPALRLVRYRHAVHELPVDAADRSLPAERDVSLLVYRSAEHDVRYLEATPLARAILERLLAGQALGAAVQAAAAEQGAELASELLAGAAKLLADLAERGVVWGPGR